MEWSTHCQWWGLAISELHSDCFCPVTVTPVVRITHRHTLVVGLWWFKLTWTWLAFNWKFRIFNRNFSSFPSLWSAAGGAWAPLLSVIINHEREHRTIHSAELREFEEAKTGWINIQSRKKLGHKNTSLSVDDKEIISFEHEKRYHSWHFNPEAIVFTLIHHFIPLTVTFTDLAHFHLTWRHHRSFEIKLSLLWTRLIRCHWERHGKNSAFEEINSLMALALEV